MSEPTKIERLMTEEPRIKPHYQSQGKQLVDFLFDEGFLSESLSRDGMDVIEELLAFYLQTEADRAWGARCAEITKKYKATPAQKEGEGPARSKEEKRWIARAKAAEARVAALEKVLVREKIADKAWEWGQKACYFLKIIQEFSLLRDQAVTLLNEALVLGITPKEIKDVPGKVILTDSKWNPIKE